MSKTLTTASQRSTHGAQLSWPAGLTAAQGDIHTITQCIWWHWWPSVYVRWLRFQLHFAAIMGFPLASLLSQLTLVSKAKSGLIHCKEESRWHHGEYTADISTRIHKCLNPRMNPLGSKICVYCKYDPLDNGIVWGGREKNDIYLMLATKIKMELRLNPWTALLRYLHGNTVYSTLAYVQVGREERI